MKQIPSRTTLWRIKRRLKKGDKPKSIGRKRMAGPQAEVEAVYRRHQLAVAGAVITLAREHGRGFPERMIKQIPKGGGLVQIAPSAPDIAARLAESEIPAPILFLQAFAIVRPAVTEDVARDAAAYYAKIEKTYGKQGEGVRLAVCAAYESLAYRGLINSTRKRRISALHIRSGLGSKTMRAYWTGHRAVKLARALINELIGHSRRYAFEVQAASRRCMMEYVEGVESGKITRPDVDAAAALMQLSPPYEREASEFRDGMQTENAEAGLKAVYDEIERFCDGA